MLKLVGMLPAVGIHTTVGINTTVGIRTTVGILSKFCSSVSSTTLPTLYHSLIYIFALSSTTTNHLKSTKTLN